MHKKKIMASYLHITIFFSYLLPEDIQLNQLSHHIRGQTFLFHYLKKKSLHNYLGNFDKS